MLSVSAMFIGMRNGHQRRQIEDKLAETAQVDISAITTETLRCLKNSQGLVAERHCCRTRRSLPRKPGYYNVIFGLSR